MMENGEKIARIKVDREIEAKVGQTVQTFCTIPYILVDQTFVSSPDSCNDKLLRFDSIK